MRRRNAEDNPKRGVEITPAMIEAGTDVLWGYYSSFDVQWEPEKVAVEVYRAMDRVADRRTEHGRRFEAAIRGARIVGHREMKDIPRKPHAKPERKPKRRKPAA